MHFAFISIPAAGHVNPTLGVLAELVRRGHRVTYFTSATYARRIEAAGGRFVASGEDWLSSVSLLGMVPAGPARMGQFMLPALKRVLADIRANFPALVDHLRVDRPDAVCFDAMTLSGRMAAEKLGMPAIALVPTYATNEHFSLRALLPRGGPPPEMVEAWQELRRSVAEFAAEQGVSAPAWFDGPPAPLNVVFLPREFQPMADTFDERFCFVGPCLGERERDTGWTRAGTNRLLFISLGTTPLNRRPDFFRMCLDAFGDGEWDVAMSIGEYVDPDSIGTVPPNIEVRPSFPQLDVLQSADVFLTHAGMNSTMEALYFGVPMVAVPQQPEQEATARRLEELGLGRRLDPAALSPGQLLKVVGDVGSDPSIRLNVARMKETVRRAGGAPAAADALEAYVRQRDRSN